MAHAVMRVRSLFLLLAQRELERLYVPKIDDSLQIPKTWVKK
jgi:hypothetical protein